LAYFRPEQNRYMIPTDVRMIVTDMDGTLLNSQHEVSDRFYEIFRKLHARGITFVAASGRQYESMVEKLGSELLDKVIIVAENGAYARFREREFLLKPLQADWVGQILDSVKGVEGTNPVLCSKDQAYVTGNDPRFMALLKEYYSDFHVVPDLNRVEDLILKVAIHNFEDSETLTYPLVSRFEGPLKVKISGKFWVDLSDPEANKGAAISYLMREYQVEPDQLMVFGDYNNDLEMLALTPYSYAMENAHPNVKAVAKFQTLSNDERGVEAVLEKLF